MSRVGGRTAASYSHREARAVLPVRFVFFFSSLLRGILVAAYCTCRAGLRGCPGVGCGTCQVTLRCRMSVSVSGEGRRAGAGNLAEGRCGAPAGSTRARLFLVTSSCCCRRLGAQARLKVTRKGRLMCGTPFGPHKSELRWVEMEVGGCQFSTFCLSILLFLRALLYSNADLFATF